MARQEVALIDEVLADRPRVVRAFGAEILLVRVDDGYRAYLNRCPHANAPLGTGRIVHGTLRCPWHGWEFDLTTGRHVLQPVCTLDAYRVEVEDGRLFVTEP